jgi:hypothetical protein
MITECDSKSMNEEEWANYQEVLLRECDRIDQRMTSRLNLRYQIAGLFITIIFGFWTAIAISIASSHQNDILPFFLIFFGIPISAILLFIWRFCTHLLISDDMGDETYLVTFKRYIQLKKPLGKPVNTLADEIANIVEWEGQNEIANNNSKILYLEDFLKTVSEEDSKSLKSVIRNLNDTQKEELIKNTDFNKLRKFSEGITSFDRPILYLIIFVLFGTSLLFTGTLLSLVPFNYILSYILNGETASTFSISIVSVTVCILSFIDSIALGLIIIFFECKLEPIRREFFWKNEIKISIKRELMKISKEMEKNN